MKIRDSLRSKTGFHTALGVALAIVSGLLLLGYLTHRAPDPGPELDVPVAGRDIEMGALIKRDMLEFKRIPARYLAPGTLRTTGEVVNARTLRFVGRGEAFVPSALAGSGSASLASSIPRDFRAYSIDLSDNSGAGPDIRPGDRVDLLSTSGDPPRTGTLLRSRLVLSVGVPAPSDQGDSGVSTGSGRITLLVSPAEAEMLAQAEGSGHISISLCPLPQAR
jgi:pilus assembly protein CpaB